MRLTNLVFFVLIVAQPIFAQQPASNAVFDSLFRNNLNEEALKMAEKWEAEATHSGPSLDLALALNKKGYCYFKLGDWPTADSLYRQAIAIATLVEKTEIIEFSNLLNDLASLCSQMGNFPEALELGQHGLDLQIKLLGENDREVLRSRRNIGLTYEYMGQLDKAEAAYLECIAVYERNNWEKDLNYATFHGDIGMAISMEGRFSAAKSHFQTNLEIIEKLFGAASQEYVQALYGYCWSLNQSGNYPELEPLVTRLVALQRSLPNGEKGEFMELALNMLGTTKTLLGLHTDAIVTLLEAKKVAKECCGTGLIQRHEVSTNLIEAYYLSGQDELAYTEALETNRLEVELEKQNAGNLLRSKAMRANRLADLGKVEEAEALLAQIEKTTVWNEMEIVDARTVYLKGKAGVAFLRKHLDECMVWLDSAIQNTLLTQGPNANFVETLLTEKATYLFRAGKYPESLRALEAMLTVKKRNILPEMAVLSDNERLKLADEFITESSILATIAWRNPELQAQAQLFDLQIFTKNLLEKTTRKASAVITASGDPALKDLYARWLDVREQLSVHFQYQNLDETQARTLAEEAESLEKNLARQGLSQVVPEELVSWTDIRAALGEGEAAVNAIRFRVPGIKDLSDTVIYAFLIVRPGQDASPDIVFLEHSDELASVLAGQFQSEIKSRKEVSPALFEKMWAPVAAKLPGVKTLYFSPDGIFHKINLNALRRADGSYLVDNLDIRLVTNLREILSREKNEPDQSPGLAVLFGNPKFKVGQMGRGEIADQALVASEERTIFRDLSGEFADGGFRLTPLPGSEREVKAIAKKLTGKNWQTAVFTGAKATEDTLKQLKSPKVLHIATHGYFLNSEKPIAPSDLLRPTPERTPPCARCCFLRVLKTALPGRTPDETMVF